MTVEGRLLVVAVGIVVVLATVLVTRFARYRSRPLAVSRLDAGVYLFTSDDCDACRRAGAVLEERGIEFAELSWQSDPDVFQATGVDAVPSVAVVDPSGRGKWWRGRVPRRLS